MRAWSCQLSPGQEDCQNDSTALLVGAGSQCDIGKKLYVYVLSERAVHLCREINTFLEHQQPDITGNHSWQRICTALWYGSAHPVSHAKRTQGCDIDTVRADILSVSIPAGSCFCQKSTSRPGASWLCQTSSVKACSTEEVCDALWRYAVLLCWNTSQYCEPDWCDILDIQDGAMMIPTGLIALRHATVCVYACSVTSDILQCL